MGVRVVTVASAAVLAVLGTLTLVLGALWALFFSIGARGTSTATMVRYNLSHASTALVAYGPLGLGILLLIAAVVLLVIGALRKPGGE